MFFHVKVQYHTVEDLQESLKKTKALEKVGFSCKREIQRLEREIQRLTRNPRKQIRCLGCGEILEVSPNYQGDLCPGCADWHDKQDWSLYDDSWGDYDQDAY